MEILDRLRSDLEKVRSARAQKQEQITRLSGELAALENQERGLQAAIEYYTVPEVKGSTSEAKGNTSNVNVSMLTIAKAAAWVIQDSGNRWMTTREIEKAFQLHGKTTRYNAIDITLKDNKKLFERKQEGGRNYFRVLGV